MSAIIPASRFKRDGDTAWWATNSPVWKHFDRPCGTCFDDDWPAGTSAPFEDCPACHGIGRHTFDIKVEQTARRWAGFHGQMIHDVRIITVSVAPGMVLPIVEATDKSDPSYPVPPESERDEAFYDPKAKEWFLWNDGCVDLLSRSLPDDAAPGMFVVKLLIHEADQ